MIIKTERQMYELSKLGAIAADTLHTMLSQLRPGVTPRMLDNHAGNLFLVQGVKSAPREAYDFPGNTCISVNECCAHGVPDDRPFEDGDVVNIDVSITRNGLWVDTGLTGFVGTVSEELQSLLRATLLARTAAIAAARPGRPVRDIAVAVEKVADAHGFTIIENIGGHGVGEHIHEPPYIANKVEAAENHILRPGEVIAIEPFLSMGSRLAKMPAGWPLLTSHQSAQAEHTVVVGRTNRIIT